MQSMATKYKHSRYQTQISAMYRCNSYQDGVYMQLPLFIDKWMNPVHSILSKFTEAMCEACVILIVQAVMLY